MTTNSPAQTSRVQSVAAHTPTPWFIGMRDAGHGNHNANTIFARDGEQHTENPAEARYYDTGICQVCKIAINLTVDEAAKDPHGAVGFANAAFIVRACNSFEQHAQELASMTANAERERLDKEELARKNAALVAERDACRQTIRSLERGQDELVKQNAALVAALEWRLQYDNDHGFGAAERERAFLHTQGRVTALEMWEREARAALAAAKE